MVLKNLTLITGCARSGTSLTAGIVHICGAFGGKLSGPNSNNRKGMFENSTVRQAIVKPFLKGIQADPMGQHPLPHIDEIRFLAPKIAEQWGRRVVKVMIDEGYPEDSPWFYKGAKICLIWPVWHLAFPGAQWVVVRRSADDIIASCLRTGFMRAFRDKEGWRQWVEKHERRFDEMKAEIEHVHEVWPERIVRGDFEEIKAIIEKLGLKWQEEKVADFVSPALWKQGRF